VSLVDGVRAIVAELREGLSEPNVSRDHTCLYCGLNPHRELGNVRVLASTLARRLDRLSSSPEAVAFSGGKDSTA